MTENTLPLCIEQMLDKDHKGFVQALQFSDSSVDNLQAVMKITNYYRQVITKHVLASQTIRARSILVIEKYSYNKEDMKRLHNLMNGLEENCKYLFDKVTKIKHKQYELITRAKSLMSGLDNDLHRPIMSCAEIQCQYFLEKFKGKTNSFKNTMDHIKSKLELITAHNEMLGNVRKLYFQEWQIELVRKSLFCMSDAIRNLVEETKVFKTLDIVEPE